MNYYISERYDADIHGEAVENFEPREVALNATTEEAARAEARKTAENNQIKRYAILFFRRSDGCHGELDS